MNTTRRQALTAMATSLVFPGLALGQEYPAKQVRLVLPYGPGGPSDLTIRVLATELGNALHQSFIVENIPGAQGALGSRRVSKAPADGYMLLLATSATHAANVFLMKDLSYDPVTDFTPVTGIADLQHIAVIRPDLNVSTVAEFVRYAKAQPKGINYASSGIGSGGHLGMEAFKRAAGFQGEHIPVTSSPAVNTEVISGRCDIAITSLPVALQSVLAGRLKPLAMASENRAPQLPNLPKLAEVGVPGCESDTWMGVWAPPATPAPIVQRLNDAIVTILKKPDVADLLLKNAITLNVRPTRAFADYVVSEVKRYGELTRSIGLKPT